MLRDPSCPAFLNTALLANAFNRNAVAAVTLATSLSCGARRNLLLCCALAVIPHCGQAASSLTKKWKGQLSTAKPTCLCGAGELLPRCDQALHEASLPPRMHSLLPVSLLNSQLSTLSEQNFTGHSAGARGVSPGILQWTLFKLFNSSAGQVRWDRKMSVAKMFDLGSLDVLQEYSRGSMQVPLVLKCQGSPCEADARKADRAVQ